MTSIETHIQTKVTAKLEEEIKKELQISDPPLDIAKAAIDDNPQRDTTKS